MTFETTGRGPESWHSVVRHCNTAEKKLWTWLLRNNRFTRLLSWWTLNLVPVACWLFAHGLDLLLVASFFCNNMASTLGCTHKERCTGDKPEQSRHTQTQLRPRSRQTGQANDPDNNPNKKIDRERPNGKEHDLTKNIPSPNTASTRETWKYMVGDSAEANDDDITEIPEPHLPTPASPNLVRHRHNELNRLVSIQKELVLAVLSSHAGKRPATCEVSSGFQAHDSPHCWSFDSFIGSCVILIDCCRGGTGV